MTEKPPYKPGDTVRLISEFDLLKVKKCEKLVGSWYVHAIDGDGNRHTAHKDRFVRVTE